MLIYPAFPRPAGASCPLSTLLDSSFTTPPSLFCPIISQTPRRHHIVASLQKGPSTSVFLTPNFEQQPVAFSFADLSPSCNSFRAILRYRWCSANDNAKGSPLSTLTSMSTSKGPRKVQPVPSSQSAVGFLSADPSMISIWSKADFPPFVAFSCLWVICCHEALLVGRKGGVATAEMGGTVGRPCHRRKRQSVTSSRETLALLYPQQRMACEWASSHNPLLDRAKR
ncbi:hypothetical protein M407DRAFT_194063 [Tulasnella calospora MUT 4182]|uniref:Uncharacterized protein n=1 Tax=Tulasnella calospora MUT 4182 TaxID=1051891 RepID=A0A0C3Q1L7_9AGAM|nr:hypothetical protein M407DRAFT_194063 [Tulasnella calospora MUT 4182]